MKANLYEGDAVTPHPSKLTPEVVTLGNHMSSRASNPVLYSYVFIAVAGVVRQP